MTIVGRIAAREISEELSWVESPTVRGCVNWGQIPIVLLDGKFRRLDVVQLLHYYWPMPVMHKFSASRVVMYAGDHLLAHVHVLLRDGRECTVELDSLTIVGRIAAREIREELSWVESNRAWLHQEWRRLNP